MFEKIDRTKIEERFRDLILAAWDHYLDLYESEGVVLANKFIFAKLLDLDAQRDTCHINANSADKAINSLNVTVNMG